MDNKFFTQLFELKLSYATFCLNMYMYTSIKLTPIRSSNFQVTF